MELLQQNTFSFVRFGFFVGFIVFYFCLCSSYLHAREPSSSHLPSLCHFPFMLPDGFNKIMGQIINTYRSNYIRHANFY